MSRRGVKRMLSKLEQSVEDGNYYEAHQMYRTLYFRYITVGRYAELLDLLFSGAKILLEKEQSTSGADLSILLVDVLQKSQTAPDNFWFFKLQTLFKLIGPYIPERETFIVQSFRWSKNKEYKVGNPMYHQLIAQVYWREKNYVHAKYHYMHSRDGAGCAHLLVELQTTRGFSSEVELFVTQAVLQYLCSTASVSPVASSSNSGNTQQRTKATETACETLVTYASHHPNISRTKGPPYNGYPLLNFLWFLLKAVESGKLQTFLVLCEQYKPSLKRDPTYLQYLDKIGQLYFNIPPPRPRGNNGGGLFGNILQSFLSGLERDVDGTGDSSGDEQLPEIVRHVSNNRIQGSSSTSIRPSTSRDSTDVHARGSDNINKGYKIDEQNDLD